jgi:cold shock CspA family protein
MTGSVVRTVIDRGFVFVKPESGPDVFLHISEFDGDFLALRVGNRVEFDVRETPRGRRAVNAAIS